MSAACQILTIAIAVGTAIKNSMDD